MVTIWHDGQVATYIKVANIYMHCKQCGVHITPDGVLNDTMGC